MFLRKSPQIFAESVIWTRKTRGEIRRGRLDKLGLQQRILGCGGNDGDLRKFIKRDLMQSEAWSLCSVNGRRFRIERQVLRVQACPGQPQGQAES